MPVHEVAIAQAIADKARQRAAGRSVTAVTIRVGHYRQVVPDALAFSWRAVTDATALAGCRLDIEETPATIRCNECAGVTTLEVPILLCDQCGGSDVTMLTGEELVMVSLELAEV